MNTSRKPDKGVFYTCIGKGGMYTIVGYAKGAGTSRDHGDIVMYRDIVNHDLPIFYRSYEDFNMRMKPYDRNEEEVFKTDYESQEAAS